MKRLLTVFILLMLAVLLGLFIYADAGYVLIYYRNYSIETTLWVLLGSILLIFLVLYCATHLINWVLNIPQIITTWFGKIRKQRARKQTKLGLYSWIKGKWLQAEKLLIKSAKHSDLPLINHLIAAYSAHALHDSNKRDYYLTIADLSVPGHQLAINLARARFQLEDHKPQESLATLQNITVETKTNYGYLDLLQKVYQELAEWEALKDLLPILAGHKILAAENFRKLQQHVYLQLFSKYESEKQYDIALQLWINLPKELHNDVEIIAKYADLLLAQHQYQATEKLLRHALQKQWHELLIDKYSLVVEVDQVKQLAFAESFLIKHPENAILLLSLGRLCRKHKLWGKAQNYLEASLSLKKDLAALKELAELMQTLNKPDLALAYYQQLVEYVRQPLIS